jgi:hypothetical protein
VLNGFAFVGVLSSFSLSSTVMYYEVVGVPNDFAFVDVCYLASLCGDLRDALLLFISLYV